MAGKNEVTLTFAGDSDKLEKAFDNVGSAAKDMDGKVGSASRNVGDSFDRTGEAADNLDTKAMGFRDTLTGVEDTGRGVAMMMKGDMFDGALMLGMGLGDLGSGIYNFIVPSFKALTTGALSSGVAMVRSAALQTVAWAKLGVQSLLAAAKVALAWIIAMGPIALVIAAVVGLVALIIANWDKVKAITIGVWTAVWGFLKGVWDKVTGSVGRAIGVIKSIFSRFHPLGIIINNWRPILEFFKGLPGKIASALSGLGRAIAGVFRSAFSGIRSAWNSTVGGRGFDIPGWVPGLGGKSFRIPYMHTGGIVPGAPGQEVLAVLQAGERVTPAGAAGGAGVVIELRSDGSKFGRAMVEALRESIRVKGGNVQIVLGS